MGRSQSSSSRVMVSGYSLLLLSGVYIALTGHYNKHIGYSLTGCRLLPGGGGFICDKSFFQ